MLGGVDDGEEVVGDVVVVVVVVDVEEERRRREREATTGNWWYARLSVKATVHMDHIVSFSRKSAPRQLSRSQHAAAACFSLFSSTDQTIRCLSWCCNFICNFNAFLSLCTMSTRGGYTSGKASRVHMCRGHSRAAMRETTFPIRPPYHTTFPSVKLNLTVDVGLTSACLYQYHISNSQLVPLQVAICFFYSPTHLAKKGTAWYYTYTCPQQRSLDPSECFR